MASDEHPEDHAVPAIEHLSTRACLRRLEAGGVGRLAMRGEAAPEIRPVNFATQAGALVIRTGDGSILAAARGAEPAAFEIDGIDRLEHTGWSVLVTGKLAELPTEPALLGLPLRPWASGVKDRFVSLSLDEVSGMSIPPGRGNR